MLELKGVSKKFRKKQVLNNIDFKFEKGIYGILGPKIGRASCRERVWSRV